MVNLPDSADRFTPYFLYEERLKSFDDRWPHKSQNLSPERVIFLFLVFCLLLRITPFVLNFILYRSISFRLSLFVFSSYNFFSNSQISDSGYVWNFRFVGLFWTIHDPSIQICYFFAFCIYLNLCFYPNFWI